MYSSSLVHVKTPRFIVFYNGVEKQPEREILKNYFDALDGKGFDYAYRYPGMNKVLQAAGRVIRTQEDTGVVALLDERFLYSSYRAMFPREWSNYKVVDKAGMEEAVAEFWAGVDLHNFDA